MPKTKRALLHAALILLLATCIYFTNTGTAVYVEKASTHRQLFDNADVLLEAKITLRLLFVFVLAMLGGFSLASLGETLFKKRK